MKPVRRRDANETPIVTALRARGCLVWQVDSDCGVPDLIVYHRKAGLMLLEVKGPKGDLTESQEKFFALIDGTECPAYVVRSADEAIAKVGLA